MAKVKIKLQMNLFSNPSQLVAAIARANPGVHFTPTSARGTMTMVSNEPLTITKETWESGQGRQSFTAIHRLIESGEYSREGDIITITPNES